jgi:iron complex transport system substrate-binding protein
VTLAPAHTETLYAIGAGPQVVAADTYSDTPAEVKPKAVLTCWPKPSLEKILSYRPDLVVVLAEEREFTNQLDAVHTPVLKLLPATVNRALEEIRILGKVSGHADQADKLTDEMQRRIAEVRSRVKGATPRRFMYEMDAVDPAKPYVAGSGGFYGDLIGLAGGKNVFEDVTKPAGRVSAEQVVARNPEVILLGDSATPVQPQSPEKVAVRTGWSTVEAVKSGRIYPVDSNLITRAGPRMVDGVEMLARLLYPERFPKPDGK